MLLENIHCLCELRCSHTIAYALRMQISEKLLKYVEGTLLIRYEYATHTFAKACSQEAGLKVVRIKCFFYEICLRFL